jgi:hypothetical protein
LICLFVYSFLMISDYAPEQVLFDLSKKTIKVNEKNIFLIQCKKKKKQEHLSFFYKRM